MPRTALAVALLAAPLTATAEPATNFSLRDLGGQTVELSDYEGQVIFVDFWATWCAPCKDAMPHWQRLYDDLKEEGFVVLAVTADDARTRPQVRPYIRRSGFTFPVLYDPDSTALTLYNPGKTLPYSVIIDQDFEVVERHAGYTSGDEVAIRGKVEALVRGASEEPADETPEAESEE